MGSFKDYKNAPEKFKNIQEFTEDQIKEIFRYIKEKSVAQKPMNDAIIAMENNCTKYIGKWKTFAVGGYGYGGIVNLFYVQEV
tara:strand:+ start:164 stop:412 length:249 start_codon:yes stop_codon:yes gene_type:complete